MVKKNLLNKQILNKFGSSDFKMLNESLKPVFINVVNEDLTYLLKNINAKTLIVFGKKDKVTPQKFAKIFNKIIKNSKIVILDSGHFCFLDENLKFINILKHFID